MDTSFAVSTYTTKTLMLFPQSAEQKAKLLYPKMNIQKIESNLDVNRLAEINAKMMLKFFSSMNAVGLKILLAIGISE